MNLGWGSVMTNGKQCLSYVTKVILLSCMARSGIGVGCRGGFCEKLLEASFMFDWTNVSKMALPLGKADPIRDHCCEAEIHHGGFHPWAGRSPKEAVSLWDAWAGAGS